MGVRLFESERQAIFATIAYIILLYATLPLTPSLVKFVSGLNMLSISIGILFLLVIGFLFWGGYRSKKLKSPGFWLTLFGVFTVYFMAAKHTSAISERMHLWLYAVLGFFLFSLLRFRLSGRTLFLLVAVIASLLGSIDEGIQYLLPNRHFGIEDIILNAVGGITSLFVIRYVFGDTGEKCIA